MLDQHHVHHIQKNFALNLILLVSIQKLLVQRLKVETVIVEAKQEDRQSDGDYNIRQLRKTYELPEHAGK